MTEDKPPVWQPTEDDWIAADMAIHDDKERGGPERRRQQRAFELQLKYMREFY